MHATNAGMPSSKENVSHVCQAMQNASLTPGQLAHGHSSGEWSLDFLNPHAPRDWSLWPQSYEATESILPSFCGIPLSSSYIPQNSTSAPLQYQPTTQATVMAPEGQYLYTQGMLQNNYQAGESYYPSLGGTNTPLFSSYTLQDNINVPYQGQPTAQASVDVNRDGYPLFTFGTQGVSPWIQTPYAQNMSTPGPHAQSSSSEQTFSDWKEYKYDGKRYYYNWKTKQSSWQKPFELMTTIERADSLTDWMEFTSREGHKYYYNKVTKQKRWTIPEELKLARARAFTSVTCPSFTETSHLASLGTVPSVQMSASAAASSSVSVMTSAVSSNPFTATSVDSAITATAAASKFSLGFDVPISGMPSHSYLETAKPGSSQERNIPLTQLSASVSASMGNPSFSMDAQMASNECRNANGSASLSNLTVTQKDSAQDMEESLVSALRSFNLKSQEVKLHEENTKREIEAAQEADRYTFKKVENLVLTVNSLKEKNEMLATGVHNEKAALTAEARDVQLRLLALSTERDECLLTIQKMHQILEERLAAANEKLATFKHNKLEREDILSKMLVEQEILLADTVQESLRFEKEVENNSKLREFVMDQHCLADQLQGELDAIREDMELLKSKVN